MKKDIVFKNADQEPVEYDGSPLTWRISVYAIVIKENSVLIVKNKTEKLYDVPGGGVEEGESLEEALKREALEEGGATINAGELITVVQDYFYHRAKGKFYQTLQLFYRAQLEGELQKPFDENNVENTFVPFRELQKYPLPPVVTKVLGMVRA